MAKVAISLPDELLDQIEASRSLTGETRSEFLRRSIKATLREERKREMDRRYREGYRRFPEAAEEFATPAATLEAVAAANPWEDDAESR